MMDKDFLKEPWYLLDQPWCHSDNAGMGILSGNMDPHVGVVIADTQDVLGDNYDNNTARAIAAHIVFIHNAILDNAMLSRLHGKALLHIEESQKLRAENEKLREKELAVDLIKKMTEKEGWGLRIVNDNPDYVGPNNVIFVSYDFGQTEKPIYGDSLLECLKRAAGELNTQEAER